MLTTSVVPELRCRRVRRFCGTSRGHCRELSFNAACRSDLQPNMRPSCTPGGGDKLRRGQCKADTGTMCLRCWCDRQPKRGLHPLPCWDIHCRCDQMWSHVIFRVHSSVRMHMDLHSLHCVNAGSDSSCTQCPEGTLSVTKGATSLDACSKCVKPDIWPPTRPVSATMPTLPPYITSLSPFALLALAGPLSSGTAPSEQSLCGAMRPAATYSLLSRPQPPC